MEFDKKDFQKEFDHMNQPRRANSEVYLELDKLNILENNILQAVMIENLETVQDGNGYKVKALSSKLIDRRDLEQLQIKYENYMALE